MNDRRWAEVMQGEVSQAQIEWEMQQEAEARERGTKVGKYGITLYWSKTLQKWVTVPED